MCLCDIYIFGSKTKVRYDVKCGIICFLNISLQFILVVWGDRTKQPLFSALFPLHEDGDEEHMSTDPPLWSRCTISTLTFFWIFFACVAVFVNSLNA